MKPKPSDVETPFNHQSIDARDWAKEFNRILVTKGDPPCDEGWMIGWFANAIMAGMDEQARRTHPKPSVKWPLKISTFDMPIGWNHDKKKAWNKAIDACQAAVEAAERTTP